MRRTPPFGAPAVATWTPLIALEVAPNLAAGDTRRFSTLGKPVGPPLLIAEGTASQPARTVLDTYDYALACVQPGPWVTLHSTRMGNTLRLARLLRSSWVSLVFLEVMAVGTELSKPA